MTKKRDFYAFTGVPIETKIRICVLKIHLGTTKTGLLKTVVDEYWKRHKKEKVGHLKGKTRTLLNVAYRSVDQYLADDEEHRHDRKE